MNIVKEPSSPVTSFIQKTHSFMKLSRAQNILPTILLMNTGAWLAKPSLQIYKSTAFFISSLITISIMSNSMILNDLFDISVDKINNPGRPLVTGEITKREAIISSLCLFLSSEILNMRYIPRDLQYITHYANVIITLYTPLLKRLALIKNITCAGLVSFSVWFSGLLINKNTKNTELLSMASLFLFLGSLYNEILLDIRDYEGDKQNGIITIPILYGKTNAWKLAFCILSLNLFSNSVILYKLYSIRESIFFLLICSQLFIKLRQIKNTDYAKNIIKSSVHDTQKQLFAVLLYMCFLRTNG
jgi:4-hydroxybenzoate polyprenyltransferase